MRDKLYNIPMVVTRGIVVFPEMIVHFDVGREKSVHAVNKAMEGNRKIFLSAQTDLSIDNPTTENISQIGCIATVKQVLKVPGENLLKVLVEGLEKAVIEQICFDEPYFGVTVKVVEDVYARLSSTKNEALTRSIKEKFDVYAQTSGRLDPDIIGHVLFDEDCGHLSDYISANLPLPWKEKQTALETLNVAKRAEHLVRVLARESEILALDNEIHQKVQQSIDENQREYFLNEQLKAINQELGISDEEAEFEGYRKSINNLSAPDEVKEKLLKEVSKLEKQPPHSHESGVIRSYIDCCIELPWGVYSKDKINIKSAKTLLDKEHYGLDKVKERILELLAVKKLSDNNNGAILCLVGPPGVGKTSIASSVAKCMGRKFQRVSLGGIKDENEIRGHRRTYIGSMPGRIISAMKDAKVSNPVILLDEIDKIGSDFKGDCSSALLEALDPEQNNTFKDHFVDLPFDLSKALFITTANDASKIPGPLYDRMEIIEITSYTAIEKLNIAKRHLVKKQLELNGISPSQLKITDGALDLIIENYTREGGVRNLERQIASICRKTAVKLLSGEEKITVTRDNLSDFLGVKKFKTESVIGKADEVGVVNGLAWTSVGGDVMQIETSVLSGSGKIELTGSLGDVMQESAKTAVSFVRSVAEQYNIDKNFYKTSDIHINATEGAIPKDGPSAGITMAVCLLSALTGATVKHDVAMTGEITLRGNILPIGGLKEKTMAAYKAGIKTVIIPIDNKPDIEEVDKVVKDNINFIYAENVKDIIAVALNIHLDQKKKTYVPQKRTEIYNKVRI